MAKRVEVNEKFIKPFFRLDGGQNDKYDPLKIKDTEFANIHDFIYDDVGNLEMRQGTTAITLDSGSDAITSIGKWTKNSAASVILVSYDTNIAKKSGSSLSDLYTSVTAGNAVKFVPYVDADGNDRCYCCSNGQNVRVIESDDSTRDAGCVAPSVKPTVALNGAGSLSGDYYYSYTFIYPWGESSESPASDLIQPSSQKVLVTLGEAFPTGATHAWIYRTTDGGSQRKLLITIANPTNNYDDQLSDGVLGDNAPTDNGTPPQSRWGYLYNNYMYYIESDSEKWYYSILDYPDIVYSTSYDNPIQDSENRPVAIHSTLNPSFLIVFYEKAIIAYDGTSPFVGDSDPLERIDINRTIGTKAPNSIVRAAGDLIFLGSDNRIYSISRVSLAASETVEPISVSERIDGTMQNDLNPDMIEKAWGIYVDRKYHLFVATGNSTTLDTVVTVDFNLETVPWVTATPVEAMSAGVMEDASGVEVPIIGGANETRLYQLYSGLTDGGTQIAPEFTSKKYTHGQLFNRKIWRKLALTGEATPEYSFRVRVYVEKDATVKQLDFNVAGVQSTGAGEDVMYDAPTTWGQGNWVYNVDWSNTVTNFKKTLDLREDGEGANATYCDGDIMWFRVYDVSSTYRLKFKGFEIRGIMKRARP